jgi:NAD(P)H-hydrate epimerase
MEKVSEKDFKKLHEPRKDSHKGKNGRLLIIAGSEVYHGASILPLKVASRIVDLVYFSSVPVNRELVKMMKADLTDFIAIPRRKIEKYLKKVDCVLIGPGVGLGWRTKRLTRRLLKKYPYRKFVIDADALKVIKPESLNKNCIVTPHKREFEQLFGVKTTEDNVEKMSKKYNCVIVLKGTKDIICSPQECKENKTGNEGMTKGGTGDVLAGLISALACKNELFTAACVGTFVNGLAGDRLEKKVSHYYNAFDLAEEIPKTMKWLEDQ